MNAENMKIDGTTLVEYNGVADTVVVPEGVTGISQHVFERSEIKSIVLPDSLQYIGEWAFFECRNLSEVNIPHNVHTIYDHAFHNSGITKVTLSSSLDNLREFAFCGCDNLIEIIIPGKVTIIRECTFENCSSLEKVEFKGSVDSIRDRAFYGCKKLKKINLPDKLSNIDSSAFWGCELLADTEDFIVINGKLTSYLGAGGEVIVPRGVNRIGKMAFFGKNGRDDIISITLPEGVEYIESWAFFGCAATKTITIPNTVECIEYGAFTGCPELERIVIPDTPKFGQEDWFGDYFEESALPPKLPLDEIEPFMNDHAFIREFNKVSIWNKLSAETQARCYLFRRDKRLKARYKKFIKPKECDQIGSIILTLLPETISAKEANAVADYIYDFSAELSDDILLQLYERIENSNKKALAKEIRWYKNTGSRIEAARDSNHYIK